MTVGGTSASATVLSKSLLFVLLGGFVGFGYFRTTLVLVV